jgi:uncharacterized RDD family membrane protein YckC
VTDHPSFTELDGATAGFVTRLLAYLLDAAIVTAFIAAGSWLMVQVDALFADMNVNLRISAASIFVVLTPFLIGAYYVVLWALTGRTVGKQVLGLKVVGSDGRPPTIGRSLLRLFGYAVSTLALWAGYLWIIVDEERRGWHDHIAKTWVVYDWGRKHRGEIYETMTEERT